MADTTAKRWRPGRGATVGLALGAAIIALALPVVAFYLGAEWTLRNHWYNLTYLQPDGRSAAEDQLGPRGPYREVTFAQYEAHLRKKMESEGRLLSDIDHEVESARVYMHMVRSGPGPGPKVFEQDGEYYLEARGPVLGSPVTVIHIEIFPKYYPSRSLHVLEYGQAAKTGGP